MKIIKPSFLLLFFFLWFTNTALAQNPKIDSLKRELKTHTQKDTVRIKILNHLAYYNYRNNPPEAIAYAEQAGKLSDEINHKKGKARSFYMKGIVYLEQAKYKISISNFKESERLYAAIDDLSGIAGCYNAMGVLYNYQGNQKLSLEYYKKALEIDQKLGIQKNIPNYLYNMGNIYADSGKYQDAIISFEKALSIFIKNDNQHGILSCWNSIAIVYKEQANYPLAIEYHNKSLDVAQKAKDSIGIFQSLNNIGSVYKEQQRYDEALGYFNKALEISQLEYNTKNITAIKSNIAAIYTQKKSFSKAISYLEEAIVLSKEINDNGQLAICLNNLGVIYLELKNYQQALDSFKEANEITKENQLQYSSVKSGIGLAKVYYQLKKYNLALSNAQKNAQLAKDFKFLKLKRDSYEILSKIYNKLGHFENALNNHKLFKVLNDSIFNKKNIEKITQIEYEYKYKQQLDSASIRELQLTKTVKATSQDLEKSKQNYLWAIIVFLIVSMLLGGIILYLKFRNIKSETQNIVIEQKLLRSQMTPHFIFNSLSVLQGMILNKEDKKSISYLSKFSKLLRIILENSRDKTVSLSQELTAIENYLVLQNLENESYKHTILVEDTIDVSLFKVPPMLIQPFVENAIEHAFVDQKENRKIDIHLTYVDKKLMCTIKDNGIGVESRRENNNKHKKSLSTSITSERLKILSKDFKMKGSVIIEDRIKYNQQGTLVTLVIPYKIDIAK